MKFLYVASAIGLYILLGGCASTVGRQDSKDNFWVGQVPNVQTGRCYTIRKGLSGLGWAAYMTDGWRCEGKKDGEMALPEDAPRI